jgi:AcrR family transcriptional regulator
LETFLFVYIDYFVNVVYGLEVPPSPTVKRPRERRRDAQYERILEAGLALIADEGIESVSMHRLAAKVDFTPGALYRYVASKDVLIARLVERVLDKVRVATDAALAAPGARASGLAAVVAALAAYRDFAAREPQAFGLLAMTMASPRVLLAKPGEAEALVARMMGTMRPMAEALVAAATAGELAPGDPIERALCLFGALHGLLMLRKQARHAPTVLDLTRLSDAATGALLLAWGARPTAIAEARARLAPASGPTRSRRKANP